MSKQSTPERIIEAAEQLMLSKGFHEVGLNEILRTVGVPKGSFYHHFDSKEDFGVKMVTHYIDEHTEERRAGFADPANGSHVMERVFGFWEKKLNVFIENGCECPCLLMKLTAEVSESSDVMREAISKGLHAWQRLYEEVIKEAMEEGVVRELEDVTREALYLQNYWYGATHHAMTIRRPEPLREALDQLRDHFTKRLAP